MNNFIDNSEEVSKTEQQTLITNVLLTAEKYKTNFPLIKEEVKNGNMKKTKLLLTTAKDVLEHKGVNEPITHLMSIRIIMELIELNMETVLNLIKKYCFPLLLEIALFKKEIKEDARGKSYFSDSPTQNQIVVGNSILRYFLVVFRK